MPASTIVGSEEQEWIWTEMVEGQGHVYVDAVAGSGKTTTALEGAKRVRDRRPTDRIGYLAFNKQVQEEMQQKAGGNGYGAALGTLTFHSLGLNAIERALGRRVRVEERRMWRVVERVMPKGKYGARNLMGSVVRLSRLAKQVSAQGWINLESVIERFDVPTLDQDDEVIDLTLQALEAAKDLSDGEVDFDDQIWLPHVMGWGEHVAKADLVISDESQDLTGGQRWLAQQAGQRVMVIGDPRQAIYAWRGADANSMQEMWRLIGLPEQLPLTYTRRCGKKIVRLAQEIVPHIKALKTAEEGSWWQARQLEAERGDMVLCRTNAPLVEAAYGLYQRGVPARIRGKDIGEGLAKMLPKANLSVVDAVRWARAEAYDEQKRLQDMGARGERRLDALEDRLKCLDWIARGCRDTNEMRLKIKSLFGTEGDWESAVQLGTVHKMKGLEARRVWVIRPDLMPHPMAAREWEREQEDNLIYVAITRAKSELVFVGGIPAGLGGD